MFEMLDGGTQIKTRVGPYVVSTIHMPAVRSFPAILETTVFNELGEEVYEHTRRYTELDEAIKGHLAVIEVEKQVF